MATLSAWEEVSNGDFCFRFDVQSKEANQVDRQSFEFTEDYKNLENPAELLKFFLERKKLIHDLLQTTGGYTSLSYIVRTTGVSDKEIKEIMESHPNEFRKSFIKTEKGEVIFMLNTPYSGILDVWRAFQYLNKKKY